MASTYSTSLKLELIGSGDQSGTWGTTTNTNLGTLLEQAIVGQTTITMANADYTLTDYNGASDEARNAAIIISGSQNASYSVICPAVQKLYMITNSLSAGATAYFKPTGGSALTIANGNTVLAYCTGTSMVALNYVSNATTATNATNLTGSGTISSTTTGTTQTAGTNNTTIATTAFVGTAVSNATGSLGTMSTQNANSVAITGGSITGITDLAVSDGGTGASTFTSNNVVLGNGTASLAGNTVAPSTSGYALRSTGSTWTSQRLGLGMTGETWHDVTGSRSYGTVYTNSNSYPIMFAVSTSSSGAAGNHQLNMYVNGVTVVVQTIAGAGNTGNGMGGVIVPPGASYYADNTGSNTTTNLSLWTELY